MIQEIEVQHFQSLRSLRVSLGRFTVITGPSSTGKSSFLRAVRLLAFNARGTSFITRGEKSCGVRMSGNESEAGLTSYEWRTSIVRGGKDAYILDLDGPDCGHTNEQYTKLAGKVPDDVAACLRLGEVNFAGQFDPPYLLDASGGEVARVLGRLTNVTLIYKAAQEANRRRMATAALLKTRQADLDEMIRQAEQYASLRDEEAAVLIAESHLTELAVLDQKRQRLSWLIMNYDMIARRLAEDPKLRSCPEPPSLDQLERMAAYRERLVQVLSEQDAAGRVLLMRQDQECTAASIAESCRQELDQYTAQWGICPSCGQPVKRKHEHGNTST